MPKLIGMDCAKNLRIDSLEDLAKTQQRLIKAMEDRIEGLTERVQALKEDKVILQKLLDFSDRAAGQRGVLMPIPDYLKIHFVNPINQQKGGLYVK